MACSPAHWATKIYPVSIQGRLKLKARRWSPCLLSNTRRLFDFSWCSFLYVVRYMFLARTSTRGRFLFETHVHSRKYGDGHFWWKSNFRQNITISYVITPMAIRLFSVLWSVYEFNTTRTEFRRNFVRMVGDRIVKYYLMGQCFLSWWRRQSRNVEDCFRH